MRIFILVFFTFLLNGIAQATCESESYQVIKHDYSGECLEVITEVMKTQGCSESDVDKVRNYSLGRGADLILEHGSSYFCKMESAEGVYQVMTSSMAEPPVAAVMFSRWDQIIGFLFDPLLLYPQSLIMLERD